MAILYDFLNYIFIVSFIVIVTEFEIFVRIFFLYSSQSISQNACYGCEKRRKFNQIRFFFFMMDDKNLKVIDTTWGRIYFLKCENFGTFTYS